MFRTLPPFGGDQRQTAEIIRGIMDGKTNNTGTLTLATGGATTTTLNDRRIGGDSVILFVPASASAVDAMVGAAGMSVVSATVPVASGIVTVLLVFVLGVAMVNVPVPLAFALNAILLISCSLNYNVTSAATDGHSYA